jgi:hypothetical protein
MFRNSQARAAGMRRSICDETTPRATGPGCIRTSVPVVMVVLLTIAIAACADDGESAKRPAGGSTATSTTTSSAGGDKLRGGPRYTREQVIEALGVTRGRDENGVPNSDLRTGCFAIKIFVTPEDNMAAYVQIGDPVATNPSGEVGAAVGTYEGVSASKCLRIFTRRLAKLA